MKKWLDPILLPGFTKKERAEYWISLACTILSCAAILTFIAIFH